MDEQNCTQAEKAAWRRRDLELAFESEVRLFQASDFNLGLEWRLRGGECLLLGGLVCFPSTDTGGQNHL